MTNSTHNNFKSNDPQSCTFTNGLIRYAGTMIFLIGIISTLLSICVFARKPLRRKSCCYYFLILAISDSIHLSTVFIELLPLSFHVDLMTVHAIFCKLVVFLIYFTNHLSIIVLTLASVDRFILIYCPSRSKRYCKTEKAKWLVGLSMLIIFLSNSHFLYGYDIIPLSNDTSTCFIRKENEIYQQFYVFYDSYIESIFFVLIPFIIMFACSLLIICQIFETRKTIRYNAKGKFYYYTFYTSETLRQTVRKTLNEEGRTRLRDKDIQLCFMLIGTTLAFLILCLPTEINDLFNYTGKYRSCFDWFRKVFFLLIQQSYFAGHLYIYTLTGQLFRKHLFIFLFGPTPGQHTTFTQKLLTNLTGYQHRLNASFTTTSFVNTTTHRPSPSTTTAAATTIPPNPNNQFVSNDPSQRLLSSSRYIIGTY